MIDQVDIQGFQSLAKVSVRLGKLTVLSGPSNSGKSAFVRALRALVTNPRGDWYMREDAPSTEVAVVIDEGEARVTFGRVKQVYYEISYPEGIADYTAVGTNVPDDVMALLKIDPDLQVTDQFDPPFLLNVPGSQVAKVLGQITKSDRMQKATGVAKSKARDQATKAKVLTDQIIRDRETLERDWAWYVPAANAVRELAPVVEELRASSARLTALMGLRDRLASLESVAAWEMPAEAVELLAAAEVVRLAEQRLTALRTYRSLIAEKDAEANRLDGNHATQLAALQAAEREALEDLTACPVCQTKFELMPVPVAGKNRVFESYGLRT